MSTLLVVLAVVVLAVFLVSITAAVVRDLGAWAAVVIWFATIALTAAIVVIAFFATGQLR